MELKAEILLGGQQFEADNDTPFVFGRTSNGPIVGLDDGDMGISAEAGSIEFQMGLWWVLNRSRKRPLFLEPSPGSPPTKIDAGDRVPITKAKTVVLVPGAIYTHRIDILISEEAVPRLHASETQTSGTITFGDVVLSDRDRQALTALFSGYLRPFPYRDPRPVSYQQAAELLGSPWTKVTVRKQVERLKERLARSQLYFQGPRANDELADHLMSSGLMSELDLSFLEGAS
jgi:hypothetical protein